MTSRADLREQRIHRGRRPLLRSFRFWIPMSLVLIVVGLIVAALIIGPKILDRAMSAKASLEQAMPLASTTQNQILAGQSAEAQATATELAELTADAREQTDDGLWKSLEWIPVVGPNLVAVRTAAAVTDDLVTSAVLPAASLNVNSLTPQNGAIDLAAIQEMQQTISDASLGVDTAVADLDGLSRDGLLPQVEDAVDKLDSSLLQLQQILSPADEIVALLPKVLGSDGPRNYLLMFQNNAESRGTGGNPAAFVMITADQGRITITQQASSLEFNNARATPIIELSPETVAIYGDKIGRWVQDTTLSPDFTETASIVRGFWAESFGTPIDAVISFDPVALSYLLKATGPVSVPLTPTGSKTVALDAGNAVPFLLNQIYSALSEPVQQDAFFTATAAGVFQAIVGGSADPKILLTALFQAVDESRLMYAPSDATESELVGETRLSGRLPSTNDTESMLGVYANDLTTGKLDYYMQLDIAAASTQCQAEQPSFSTTATLTNTLAEADVAGLAKYVSPAYHFPRGVVSTDVVLYGPVGSTLTSVSVDGVAVPVDGLPYAGRAAAKVNVENAPGVTHTVTAEFSAPEGDYGPLSVRHTPMVRETAVTLDSPGC